jgi:hypothetical protein
MRDGVPVYQQASGGEGGNVLYRRYIGSPTSDIDSRTAWMMTPSTGLVQCSGFTYLNSHHIPGPQGYAPSAVGYSKGPNGRGDGEGMFDLTAEDPECHVHNTVAATILAGTTAALPSSQENTSVCVRVTQSTDSTQIMHDVRRCR